MDFAAFLGSRCGFQYQPRVRRRRAQVLCLWIFSVIALITIQAIGRALGCARQSPSGRSARSHRQEPRRYALIIAEVKDEIKRAA